MSNITSYNPRSCIAGKVMRIHRATASIFRKHLLPYGVSNSQFSLLFILAKRGNSTQVELSKITVLEKSSLNRNLKRLFDKGYISKANLPALDLTPLGVDFVENTLPAWKNAMDEINLLLAEDGEHALDIIHSKLVHKPN